MSWTVQLWAGTNPHQLLVGLTNCSWDYEDRMLVCSQPAQLVHESARADSPRFSLLHFILFVYACIDCHRLRTKNSADLLAQAVATLKENEQFELSSVGAVKEVAPGMALISIKTLAKLQNAVCEKCGETKI